MNAQEMQETLDQISAQYARFGETQYDMDYFQLEPATDEEIADLESTIGQPLPDELKLFLKLNKVRHSFTGNFSCLTAEGIKREWEMMKGLVEDGTFDGWVEQRDFGNWNDGRLERVWWSTNWIPIAADSCGNLHCIDLGPGPKGHVGQIMNMENQDGQGPYPTDWSSLSHYLQMHLRYLREGRVEKWGEDLAVDHYGPVNPEYAE